MGALCRLWSLRRRRPWFVAGALGLLAFLLVYPAVQLWLQTLGVAGEFTYHDVSAYRSAVHNWAVGESLYVRDEGGGFHGSYLYPPVYVLLFWPLAQLPFDQSGVLLEVVSVGLLWAGLKAVVAAYDLRLAWYEDVLLLWALLGFQPLILAVRIGQTSAFLAGLLAFALAALVYAERREGDAGRRLQYLSGALTAVAGTVKLVYAPVGAHLLADRRRFAAAVATGLGLLALGLAVFGVDAHRGYLEVLRWGKGWGESRPPSLWLPGYYRPAYVLGSLSLPVQVALAAGVAAVSLLAADEGVDDLVFALGVAAMPLVTPRVYTLDLVVLLPVVVVLLATELDRADGRPLVPVVGLWLVAVHAYGLYAVVESLPTRLPDGVGQTLVEHAAWLQPGVWGTLLIAGLAGRRVLGAAVAGRRRPAAEGASSDGVPGGGAAPACDDDPGRDDDAAGGR